jgi:glycosyltransferase involved in cell wall biosynthesis
MKEKLLLISPLPTRYTSDGGFEIESQALNSEFSQILNHFQKLTVGCILVPNDQQEMPEISSWSPVSKSSVADRLEIIPLPYAYKLTDFVANYQKTRALLRQEILKSDYLAFSPYVLIGDWAGIACLEASSLGRAYAFMVARLEYEIMKATAQKQPLKRRLKYPITTNLIKYYIKFLASQSNVALLQGSDCFNEFSSVCSQPFLVHKVSTDKQDQVSQADLDQKLAGITNGDPLQICYSGRLGEMKSPLDWVRAIHLACQSGVKLRATWLGDGPLLAESQALAQQLEVDQYIDFPGFVSDRQRVLSIMKSSHIFMFCHKTPESARCLIEALVSGCPIVGYTSAHADGLVAQKGGGELVPVNDWKKLAETIVCLDQDRLKLAELGRQAALTGENFDQESIYQYRSRLIKQYAGQSELQLRKF